MSYPNKIGFHVPYTWDESTHMACTLAELAMRLGVPTTWLSSQAHNTDVHYRWDNLVLSGQRQNYSAWRQDCSHLVWFDVQKNKVLEAEKAGQKNILVALWHRLTREDIQVFPHYDAIVFPQPVVRIEDYEEADFPVVDIPWDCGLTPSVNQSQWESKRILCHIDSQTARAIGPLVMNAMRTILDFDKDITFTISYARNWTTEAMRSMADLIRTHPDRVKPLKRASHVDRVEAYNRHGWTFLPSVRENSCHYALESLSQGTPVIAFDYRPFGAALVSGVNSCLIPCEIAYNEFNAPEPVVNAFDLGEQLRLLAENDNIHTQLTDHMLLNPALDEEARKRKRVFETGWQILWGLD